MAGRIKEISVHAGSTNYSVYIGESILGECLDTERLAKADRIAIVVSRRVYGLHREYLDHHLVNLPNSDLFLMDDSEENKSYGYAEGFLNGFIAKGLTRKSLVIGVGGGVVGDFTGYLASLYMRGIALIHVPTTLLAMVDSSVGGKVAVNLERGKNIAGAFHQPERVIADLRFLSTLPDNEFRNGLAEIIKHGAVGDRRTLEILDGSDFAVLRSGSDLAELVVCSVAFKADIVSRDEREEGVRAILNFGHTVGHAMESLFAYRDISHGEAVAAGMAAEIIISKRMALLPENEAQHLISLIRAYGLISRRWDLSADDIVEHMRYDKKNVGHNVRFVLLEGLCAPVFDRSVPAEILYSVLSELFKA